MYITVAIIFFLLGLGLIATMYGKDVQNLYLSMQSRRQTQKLRKHEAKLIAEKSKKLDEKLNYLIMIYNADSQAIIEASNLNQHEQERLKELLE